MLIIEEEKLFRHRHGPARKPTCCTSCTEIFADCCCPTAYDSYSASCKCRVSLFEPLIVNKVLYQDAMKTLHSKNCFEFRQSSKGITSLLSRFSPTGLGLFRRVLFSFSEEDIKDWTTENHLPEWTALITFIKHNFNLPNLCLSIRCDIFELCMGMKTEAQTRFAFVACCEIANTLCMLRGHELCDLHFIVGWFKNLEPFFEKQVMGKDYDSRRGNKYSKTGSSIRGRRYHVPSWHRRLHPAP